MSGWVLGQRLLAHGVKFETMPVRAHCQNHGQERDTFLVDDKFSTLLDARYENVKYIEVGIDSNDRCATLARKRVYVLSDENFTSYVRGLWLTSKKPEGLSAHKLLFVMDPPNSSKKNEA